MLRPLVLSLVPLALLMAEAVKIDRPYTPVERRHWSFQPRKAAPVPQFTEAEDQKWVRSPIDAFLLARLKKEGLRPAPEADRRTLVRRVTFDLTGLPPTPQEVAAFVNDQAPDAYEKLVDRLLASPRYGERWGQKWLDVVRFAETDGFEYDTHRGDAYRYRDYVIRSFNRDKPYDQFVREQLSGDEQPHPDEELRIASGFHRLGALRKNAGNQEVASSRNEVLTEMTNVIGSALMGVTLGCARCHDHKFDPIRHTDYYRMQAFFATTQPEDVLLASKEEQSAWKVKADAVEGEIKIMKEAMKSLTGEAKVTMERKVMEAEARMPDPLPSLFSVKNDPAQATPIYVLARGDYQNRGAAVGVRPLGVLLPDAAPEQPLTTEHPRTQLADWLLNPQHPLTARVIVNRVWLQHFGRGIVATPNDFGRMGARPTHPELLDWLAERFVEDGWRFKPLHRLMVLSSAYRQDAQSPDATKAREKDPQNALVWHHSRSRLEAEEIRDSMLSVSGRLNEKMGGPSVMVPIDPSLLTLLYKPSQWKVNPDPREHDRRSIYLLAKRNLRLPFMETFDAPDRQISCPVRESSTHPPQALELLNGDFANRMAAALAERLRQEGGKRTARQVELAYQLTAGRAPTPAEKKLAEAFLKQQPLSEFALAMLNLNSFLYVE